MSELNIGIVGLGSVAGAHIPAKIMVYLTDKGDFPGFMAIKDRYLSSDLPAQTVVVVAFGSPEFKVEVEAIAVLS